MMECCCSVRCERKSLRSIDLGVIGGVVEVEGCLVFTLVNMVCVKFAWIFGIGFVMYGEQDDCVVNV